MFACSLKKVPNDSGDYLVSFITHLKIVSRVFIRNLHTH